MLPENAGMAMALFGFLAVGAVSVFTMVSVASWSEARRKEREAYYKNDMLKKLADTPGPGANAALELMRAEAQIGAARTRQGLRIGGMITTAAGIGVLVFLRALLGGQGGVFLCGLIPLFVGLALYGSSYLVSTPME